LSFIAAAVADAAAGCAVVIATDPGYGAWSLTSDAATIACYAAEEPQSTPQLPP